MLPESQSSQLPAVYQPVALVQIFGGIAGTGIEGRCGDEQALGGLVPVKTAEEIADRAGTYAVARRITFGLDVNPVKSQLILIDHTINAIVSAAPERTPSFSNLSAIAHGQQKVDDQPLKEVRWCCAPTIQQILCQQIGRAHV